MTPDVLGTIYGVLWLAAVIFAARCAWKSAVRIWGKD